MLTIPTVFKDFKTNFGFIDLKQQTPWKWSKDQNDWRFKREVLEWVTILIEIATENYREFIELVTVFLVAW